MRKLFSILIGLLLLPTLQGQILRSPYYAIAIPQEEEVDTTQMEVDRYIVGLSTALVDSVFEKIDTFVRSLKDSLNIDSLPQAFDVLYILGNQTSEVAMRNLVERDHDITDNSSTAFVAFEGFTGDGSDDYLKTDFIPSTDGVNYTKDDASHGAYVRNNAQSGGVMFGVRSSVPENTGIYLYPRNATNEVYVRINDIGSSITFANSDSRALFTSVRTSSTAVVVYQNKTANSLADASKSLATNQIYICARNYAETADSKNSTHQISLFFMGGSFTADEVADIVDVFEVYMDSNGKGII